MAANIETKSQPRRETEIVGNVLRYPRSGIKVIIVGAGPGGLFTAIESWRKGHDVEILEKAPKPSTLGDIVALGPSAWSTLRNYPTMLQEYAKVTIDTQTVPFHMNGEQIAPPAEFEWNRPGVAKHASYPVRVSPIIGRADLADLYLLQAQRLGIQITWNVSIVDYTEDVVTGHGIAISSDGKEYQADVIVVADGIGSKSHKLILGRSVRAVETGYTVYRAAVQTGNLPITSSVRQLAESLERPQTRLYAGHGHHVVIVLSKRLVSLAVTLPKENAEDSVESWTSTITAEDLIRRFPRFEELGQTIRDTIGCFPDGSIVAWKLCMRGPQSTWISKLGHVIQVGDSAHSFVPTSANGATMAVEDGTTLAECLALAGRENIQLAAQVYESLRKDRVTLVQQMGLLNRAIWHQDSDEGIKELSKAKQGKWLWTHDAERYARENFLGAKESINSGVKFANTNLPPGFHLKLWTLDEVIRNEQAGIIENLAENGDWGIE